MWAHWPNHLPKALPSKTIIMVLKISIYEILGEQEPLDHSSLKNVNWKYLIFVVIVYSMQPIDMINTYYKLITTIALVNMPALSITMSFLCGENS